MSSRSITADDTDLQNEKTNIRLSPKVAFALTYSTYSILYLLRKVSSVAKPFIKEDLSITARELGWIDSAFFISYSLFQVLTGALTSILGRKKTLVLSLLLGAVTATLFSFASEPITFILLWCLHGIAQAPCFSCLLPIVLSSFESGSSGNGIALWTTSQQTGAILSAVIGTWLCANFSWRYAYLVPSAVFAVAAFVLYSTLPNDQKKSTSRRSEAAGALLSLRMGMKINGVWLASLIYAHVKLIRYCLLFWLPTMLIAATGVDADTAGYGSVLFDFAGVLGSVIVGRLVDKFYPNNPIEISSLLFSLLVIMLMICCQVVNWTSTVGDNGEQPDSSISFPVILSLVGLIGVFVACVDIVYGSITPSFITANYKNSTGDQNDYETSVIGIVNGIGSLGGFLQGYVTPKIVEMSGGKWNHLIYFLGMNAVSGGILAYILLRMSKNEVTDPKIRSHSGRLDDGLEMADTI